MLEHYGLNGGKASDWLRQFQQQETQTCPNHSSRLANETCPEPYGSINHIPSRLEGMWGIVHRKAGGLADAQHSPPGH